MGTRSHRLAPTRARRTTRVRCCPISTSPPISHSALVRMADEVCLQMHLLYLSFAIAVRARAADEAEAVSMCTRGLTGIAGLAAERIHKALGIARRARRRPAGARVAPPAQSRGLCRGGNEANRLTVHRSPAHDDDAWIALCSPDSVQPLQAIATRWIRTSRCVLAGRTPNGPPSGRNRFYCSRIV